MDSTLEFVYDKYSPVMYGVAMQITSDRMEAERILIACFKKLSTQKDLNPDQLLLGVQLIKLTIQTACELFSKYKKEEVLLKQYQQTPILRSALCEKMSIQSLSKQKKLNSQQLMTDLKSELSLFLNRRKRYVARLITVP